MSYSSLSTNKRIAKNSLILYARMLVVTIISLYTSRVVLEVLGVEDFGIYNIAGGVVALLGILNLSMSSSAQRFLSTKIGEKKVDEVHLIFNRSLTVHIAISLLVILLGETLGLWLFNSKLNIPENRMDAAFWVYQFSLVTTACSIVRTAFTAVVISYEKMSFLAYTSIIEVIFKLAICYVLLIVSFDSLKVYSFLMMTVMAALLLTYMFYCRKVIRMKFYKYDPFTIEKYRDLLTFSGWTMVGGIFSVSSWQILNIVYNFFFGVLLNAAMGICNQVLNSLAGLILNFQTAYKPPLVKFYASHNYREFHQLVSRASRFSFYLVFVVTAPLFFSCDYVLYLWLHTVPPYTSVFVQIVILHFWLDAASLPFFYAIEASGRIRTYHITASMVFFFSTVIAVVLVCFFRAPIGAMIITSILASFILALVRLYYYLRIASLCVSDIFFHTFSKVLLVAVFAVPFYYTVTLFFTGFALLVALIILSFIVSLPLVYWVGILKEERSFIRNFIFRIIKR